MKVFSCGVEVEMTEEEYQAELRKGFLNRKKMWLEDVNMAARACGISAEQMIGVLKGMKEGALNDLMDWSEIDKFLYGG